MTKDQFLDNENLEFHSSQSQSIAEQEEDRLYEQLMWEVLPEIEEAEQQVIKEALELRNWILFQ